MIIMEKFINMGTEFIKVYLLHVVETIRGFRESLSKGAGSLLTHSVVSGNHFSRMVSLIWEVFSMMISWGDWMMNKFK